MSSSLAFSRLGWIVLKALEKSRKVMQVVLLCLASAEYTFCSGQLMALSTPTWGLEANYSRSCDGNTRGLRCARSSLPMTFIKLEVSAISL